jgi:hypothetical protein
MSKNHTPSGPDISRSPEFYRPQKTFVPMPLPFPDHDRSVDAPDTRETVLRAADCPLLTQHRIAHPRIAPNETPSRGFLALR